MRRLRVIILPAFVGRSDILGISPRAYPTKVVADIGIHVDYLTELMCGRRDEMEAVSFLVSIYSSRIDLSRSKK
ncbi:hypothetical protein GGS23DRAFT_548815 [Durotheca rogersii]|uniref:uncharacterized protein n=1 Tax=Durotheca rogersii TaxID=419775 RepID=UPI00221ECD67|nr:uncharacterized protein GGS23DRAFT_548815 [Durotheca rogersii]KAI5867552.1 hypothetical protein GGS23DRAFT_548815 [Durotheca rogersii]